jgi:hypothetical protein
MGYHGVNLGRRKAPRDDAHRPARIILPFSGSPRGELRGQIGGRLPCKRRVGRADAFTPGSMAGAARSKVACGVAAIVKRSAGRRRFGCSRGRLPPRASRIIGRYPGAFLPRQPLRDRPHDRMVAATARIIVELSVEISRVEACNARREPSVAFALDAVAGKAGRARTRVPASESNDLARRAKRVGAGRGAARRQHEQEGKGGAGHAGGTICN